MPRVRRDHLALIARRHTSTSSFAARIGTSSPWNSSLSSLLSRSASTTPAGRGDRRTPQRLRGEARRASPYPPVCSSTPNGHTRLSQDPLLVDETAPGDAPPRPPAARADRRTRRSLRKQLRLNPITDPARQTPPYAAGPRHRRPIRRHQFRPQPPRPPYSRSHDVLQDRLPRGQITLEVHTRTLPLRYGIRDLHARISQQRH